MADGITSNSVALIKLCDYNQIILKRSLTVGLYIVKPKGLRNDTIAYMLVGLHRQLRHSSSIINVICAYSCIKCSLRLTR